MINIVSRSITSAHTRGPRKVVINTIKGLAAIGVPYVVNQDLRATDFIWIHDDPVALEEVAKLPPQVRILAGPNVYTQPSEIPAAIASDRKIIWLHPAPWVQSFWEAFGGAKLQSMVWPAGIDTDTFKPTNDVKDTTVVYNKSRNARDVAVVCTTLKERGESFEVLTYGNYAEPEYQSLLKRSKAAIWVGRSESQGIALLEAMAMNIPVLVWDVTHFGEWEGGGKDRFSQAQLEWSEVTTAPYFDATCGLKFTNATALPHAIQSFFKSLGTYSPRSYVKQELSLIKQAEALVDIFLVHPDTTIEMLNDSSLRTTKKWRNASWRFRAITRTKDALKRLVR